MEKWSSVRNNHSFYLECLLLLTSSKSALTTAQSTGIISYLVKKLKLKEEKLTCLRSPLIYEGTELKFEPRYICQQSPCFYPLHYLISITDSILCSSVHEKISTGCKKKLDTICHTKWLSKTNSDKRLG